MKFLLFYCYINGFLISNIKTTKLIKIHIIAIINKMTLIFAVFVLSKPNVPAKMPLVINNAKMIKIQMLIVMKKPTFNV